MRGVVLGVHVEEGGDGTAAGVVYFDLEGFDDRDGFVGGG